MQGQQAIGSAAIAADFSYLKKMRVLCREGLPLLPGTEVAVALLGLCWRFMQEVEAGAFLSQRPILLIVN